MCIRGFSEATGMPQVDWKQVEGEERLNPKSPLQSTSSMS